MTVVDVNTGKFTGSGGNLEETVTKNNLEAAEEIVRQLRLRDIGGIIVVDFIDMVLESNRDLVLRRLVECLGRDRTRHQVAEVTSLGLVQMTRKRIGTGLLEAFSDDCDHCHGRGVVIDEAPVEPKQPEDDGAAAAGAAAAGASRQDADETTARARPAPSPKDVAAMARHERAEAEQAEAEQAEHEQAEHDAAAEADRGDRGGRGDRTPSRSRPRPTRPRSPRPRPPSPGRRGACRRAGARSPRAEPVRGGARAGAAGRARAPARGHPHPPPVGQSPGRTARHGARRRRAGRGAGRIRRGRDRRPARDARGRGARTARAGQAQGRRPQALTSRRVRLDRRQGRR